MDITGAGAITRIAALIRTIIGAITTRYF